MKLLDIFTSGKPKHQILTAIIASLVFIPVVFLIISWTPTPTQKQTHKSPVYYDWAEVFDAGGKSAFRTPDGWDFAYALPDGTVFIKKQVKE